MLFFGWLLLIASGIEVAQAVMVGLFFIIGGLFQLIRSFAVTLPGWGRQALDGAVTVLLGLLVLAQWPVSGLWVSDRSFRRHRPDFLRLRVDRAGARFAHKLRRSARSKSRLHRRNARLALLTCYESGDTRMSRVPLRYWWLRRRRYRGESALDRYC
jgi:membrane-bound ClpP family serine protease